jgi:UDP-2,4-diacetamido-2,4,6-trideoxy-beta-L-altropyranose hydrolase
MSALHLALLTESGPAVGLGHLSRCAALARAAVQAGGRATMLLRGEPPGAPAWDGAASVARCDWIRGLSEAMDALRWLRPDAIVVDSYAAAPEHLAALRALGPVVVLDDLADRPLPVDAVVNGSVAAESLPYDRASGARFLLGPRYAPLDPGFAAPPEPRPGRRVKRVFVCLGGGQQNGALRAAVAAVGHALPGSAVDVITGGFDGEISEARSSRAVFHRGRFGLRELMARADVAVSGGGVTLSELAATATPAVAVLLAQNQRPNLDAFARAGAALPAGAADDPALGESIELALRALAGDGTLRQAMGARGRALVDGGGAARVVEAIGRLAGTRG